jgi:hypothetical protein
MTPIEPSPQVAAYAAAAYTAKHALSLVTDQTSLETACDAIKEAIIRSLPLSGIDLAIASLLRDQDGHRPPTLLWLHYTLQSQLRQMRLSGRWAA